jgi:tetratricopeptide (TPR) repeat protein
MEATPATEHNPLGLSLDFMFGRGYLWAERQRLSDWIALESLRMEIPDLKFPFDARSGLDRFRHTRCLVREVEFAISEVGLGDLLTEAASQLEGFQELKVRFLEDAAHISLRIKAFGANTHISFRAALIPPEPARADEIHLSLYDFRAFGPLPYPARLLAYELMTSLLNTPTLRAPGRGRSFTIGIAGDVLSFRPLKLLFLHIFPKVGWKLPNLSNIVLDSARIRPGVLTIRAVSHDDALSRNRPGQTHHLAASFEGARALAAYEAKDLFAHADQALFDGQIRQALNLLASYRDIYGLHPALVSRLLDCLLADPSPSNLAEVESLCRELTQEDPRDLLPLLARPVMGLISGKREETKQAFDRLAAELRSRNQTMDWILCELSAAQFLRNDEPELAASRLREVLKIAPRERVALEALRELYVRLGERVGLEETLKRLTGVYTDRETLKSTYLTLARHLMDGQGDLAEARMYLEKALRLDPTELDALHTLGESYVLGGEPLRALKAFGSAARAAESAERDREASRLHFRVAQIWFEELEDPNQALLSCRRSLALGTASPKDWQEIEERAEGLRFAALMCEARGRSEEAGACWSELIPMLEKAREAAPLTLGSTVLDDQSLRELRAGWTSKILEAHRHLGRLYELRERPHTAASHWRRVLELVPGDAEAVERLEDFLRKGGRPEELIELYNELLAGAGDDRTRLDVLERLVEIYTAMGLVEDAQQHLRQALDIAPGSTELRHRLIELLTSHRRYQTLRDALNSMLARARERDLRWELLLELATLLEGPIDDPEQAARAYLEAMHLRPGERQTLEAASRVLEVVISRKGASAPAPVGSHSVGRLLENLLIRLAEVAPTPAQQRDSLLRVAMLADERGDGAAAAEARRRAKELATTSSDTQEVYDDVDRRLDAMLDSLLDDELDDELDFDAGLDEDDIGLDALTAEFEGEELDEGLTGTGVTGTGVTGTGVTGTQAAGTEPGALDAFRQKFQSLLKSPAELPSRQSVPSGSPMAKVLRPLTGVSGQPSLKTPLEAALESLAAAREDDDPEAIVELIEAVFEIADDDPQGLSEQQRRALNREMGELLYYELEEADRALPYLEAVRADTTQPASPSVLNALESIYEEQGQIDARIHLLETRLAAAESEEMATTFRLLLAQLIWDQQTDAARARTYIDAVLARDPQHEAAHRLLAEIAAAASDWATVARHLETVVRVAGGGLDAVESERELADVLLNRLGRPEKAMSHFENVLTAAPGDSLALEGIKRCQASLGDWQGYVASLGRELGLLIGKPRGLATADLFALKANDIAPALRVAASQIMADIAHIFESDLDEHEQARSLWGLSFELWPEHVEALERRIALDRQVDAPADLANDLEAFAAMLLDPHARFAVLVECATLRVERLGDEEGAEPLYAEAIALVQDEAQPPEGLDEARRALKRLQSVGEL